MAANTGRSVAFLWGGSAVLGVREKGITFNSEPIDITSDEDGGWRLLMSDAVGERSVDISISGVTKDKRFLADLADGTYQRTAKLTWPDGAVLEGTFHLASTSRSTPYKDAESFDATLQSSGPVAFTPGV